MPSPAAFRKPPPFGSVGFSGTRAGLRAKQKSSLREVLLWLRGQRLHHGGCKGADVEAHALAAGAGYETHLHPSDLRETWGKCEPLYDRLYEPRPPLVRNKDIVWLSYVLIACPRRFEEERRSGTWATVRFARKVGIPIIIVWPDGRAEAE